MTAAYPPPVAAQSLDSVGKSTSLFPRSLSKSLMMSHWFLWGHMSDLEPISPWVWGYETRIGQFWSHDTPWFFFFFLFCFWWSLLFRGHVSSEQGRGNDSEGNHGLLLPEKGVDRYWVVKQLNVTISSFCSSEADRRSQWIWIRILVSDSSFFVCEIFCIGGQKSHTILTLILCSLSCRIIRLKVGGGIGSVSPPSGYKRKEGP